MGRKPAGETNEEEATAAYSSAMLDLCKLAAAAHANDDDAASTYAPLEERALELSGNAVYDFFFLLLFH